MPRVIGLISGTSVDGIDAALVEISGTDVDLKIELLAGETYPYPEKLREQILQVCAGAALSMAQLAELDDAIAIQFAQAARDIQTNHPPADLIGSHGQTVYHRPPVKHRRGGDKGDKGAFTPLGYSLQLGRGSMIAQLTGIKTICNFRAADIAAGGEGAPMVSKIDAFLLSSPTQHRCVQNIGGIGNVTYLPARQGDWIDKICGWDTGPGNTLLDLAVQHFTGGSQTYDKDGNLAASGTPCEMLVKTWLSHDFFQAAPPKSTGRELFGWEYWNQCLADGSEYKLTPADMLATLTELTACSIVQSYQRFLPQMPEMVLLCGGGSQNLYLKQRLTEQLGSIQVITTDALGVNAGFKEAIAFATLAHWRTLGIPGNLPNVTGASSALILGDVYLPLKQHRDEQPCIS